MRTGKDTFDALMAIVDRYRSSKDQVFPSGARLVRPLPWIHQNSWLHRVMPPCSAEAVATLAPATRRQPPRVLVEFLQSANGLDLFNHSLSIYGVRGDFTRSFELQALLLPFDLADESVFYSGRFLETDDFAIGSCGPEVDKCIWRAPDGRIERLRQSDGSLLESWPSFHAWLTQEAERYALCHDAEGRLLNPLPVQPGKAAPWPQETFVVGRPVRWSPAWWWMLEEWLRLPTDTLPFGWWRKLKIVVLSWLHKWLQSR